MIISLIVGIGLAVASNANQHLLNVKNKFDTLNGLETLWHQMDNFAIENQRKIEFANFRTLEGNCSKVDEEDRYTIFDDHAQMLCKGMISLSKNVEKHLKCRYIDHGNPFLKIAPFKQEIVYLDPYIVIYHNVITNEEIEALQELAFPMLQPSVVRSKSEGRHESKIRISKTAWLDDDYDGVMTVNRRAEDMSNLNIDTAEPLQIAFYKPGGYFNRHNDFYPKKFDPFPELGLGNRIGTLMFYLNEVQKGGETIFYYLNVIITPKKGNAVFWYNILPNGELDYYTQHAGCHVNSGVKWVANKWFHESGQEFRKPCSFKNIADHGQSHKG